MGEWIRKGIHLSGCILPFLAQINLMVTVYSLAGLIIIYLISEIIRNDQGETRSRTRPDDKELGPSEHKTGKGSETPGDIDVFPACARHSCSKFGIDQSAREHKQRCQKPKQEDRVEGTEISGDDLRRRIDTGTYGDADQDGDSVGNTQYLPKGRFLIYV